MKMQFYINDQRRYRLFYIVPGHVELCR